MLDAQLISQIDDAIARQQARFLAVETTLNKTASVLRQFQAEREATVAHLREEFGDSVLDAFLEEKVPVEETGEPLEPPESLLAPAPLEPALVEPAEEPVEPVTEPVVEPAEEERVEPTEEEPGGEPAVEPVVEPTEEEPGGEPVVEPVVEPAEEPGGEPAVVPAEEPGQPAVETVVEPAEETAPTVEPEEQPVAVEPEVVEPAEGVDVVDLEVGEVGRSSEAEGADQGGSEAARNEGTAEEVVTPEPVSRTVPRGNFFVAFMTPAALGFGVALMRDKTKGTMHIIVDKINDSRPSAGQLQVLDELVAVGQERIGSVSSKARFNEIVQQIRTTSRPIVLMFHRSDRRYLQANFAADTL